MSITSLFPRDRSSPRNAEPVASAEPQDQVLELNRQYLAAARAGDDAWFGAHLAEDAVLVLGDGRRFHKPDYLRVLREEPRPFRSLAARDVTVRAFGSVIQVDAEVPWELTDGSRGVSRYIDTWIWRDGRWQVVSAQVTPVPGSSAEG
jgi:hypothetical protein